MSFWLDRFREDEDEIWKELRYWLTHPVTKSEQTERTKQEKAYIDSVLDKTFGKNESLKPKKEPYLRYEELLEDNKNQPNVLSKMPESVQETIKKVKKSVFSRMSVFRFLFSSH